MVGETVTLNGSKSTDTDGDPLSYQWSKDSAQTAIAVNSNPTAIGTRLDFRAGSAGMYAVNLLSTTAFSIVSLQQPR